MLRFTSAADLARIETKLDELLLETRLRNAQWDNVTSKFDLILVLLQALGDDVRRRRQLEEDDKPRIILPLQAEGLPM